MRAESHGALPLVCFTQNQRDEVRDLGGAAGSLQAESGTHQTNYVVYPGVGITDPRNGNNPKPGDPCPTLTDDSRYYLVGESEGGGTAMRNGRVHGRTRREGKVDRMVRGRDNADAESRAERREYRPGRGLSDQPDGSDEGGQR